MRLSPIVRLALLSFVVLSCNQPGRVTKVEYTSLSLDYTTSDSATHQLLAPYKEKMDKEMNEIVGVTDTAYVREKDKPESLLGNLVADIVMQASVKAGVPADICLLNNGGLRTSLPKGEISRGKLFELMPFDNEIVVVTVTGAKMKELVNYVAAAGGVPVSGMKMGIKGRVPVDVRIASQPVDTSKTYRIATSDYLAGGGDKMSFFSQPVKTEITGVKIRDALINYFRSEKQQGHIIKSKLDGRVYYAR